MDTDSLDWIPANQARVPSPVDKKPNYDERVSEIVGRPVLANDPMLLKLVVKFKAETGSTFEQKGRDDFLFNAKFISELKDTFIIK